MEMRRGTTRKVRRTTVREKARRKRRQRLRKAMISQSDLSSSHFRVTILND